MPGDQDPAVLDPQEEILPEEIPAAGEEIPENGEESSEEIPAAGEEIPEEKEEIPEEEKEVSEEGEGTLVDGEEVLNGEDNGSSVDPVLSDPDFLDFLSDYISARQNADASDDLFSGEENSLEESGSSEDSEVLKEDPASDSPGISQYVVSFNGGSDVFTVTPVSDVDAAPASVAASNAAYTPQAWQINLAENRSFGEHYIMWAERIYSGSSSYYWRYHIALGSKISYASNVYTYTDAEVYTYYSYNSSVTYDVSVSSGTVSGSSYLVYSDLYFDYVGVDPAFKGSVYIFFALFVIIIALLIYWREKKCMRRWLLLSGIPRKAVNRFSILPAWHLRLFSSVNFIRF